MSRSRQGYYAPRGMIKHEDGARHNNGKLPLWEYSRGSDPQGVKEEDRMLMIEFRRRSLAM